MLKEKTKASLAGFIEKLLLNSIQKKGRAVISVFELSQILLNHPLWDFIESENILESIEYNPNLVLKDNKIYLESKIKKPEKLNITSPLTAPPQLLYYPAGFLGVSRIQTHGISSTASEPAVFYTNVNQIQVLSQSFNSKKIIFEINAFQAHLNGVRFHFGQFNTYLAGFVPAKFINKML